MCVASPMERKVFPQSDSVVNFKSDYIFSVNFEDRDSSETEIDEVKIYSVSDSDMKIGFIEDSAEISKVIPLYVIKSIGYKNGKSVGKYTGLGVVTALGAGIVTAVIAGSGKTSGHQNGYAALGYIVIILGLPVIGAVTGAVIGAFVDRYTDYDMAKYNYDMKVKAMRLKLIVKEGMRYSH